MKCFVIFSQVVVFASPEFEAALMTIQDKTSCEVILTGYGFWNLDFFRFFILPYCVSQDLKIIHMLVLQYVSTFYPLLLSALTYACVELHAYGYNFLNVFAM